MPLASVPETTQAVMTQNKPQQTHHNFFSSCDDHKDASPSPEAAQDQISEVSTTSTKFCVTEEHFAVEENTKSQEEEKKEDNEEEEEKLESEGWAVFRADGIQLQLDLKQRVERERREKDAEMDAEKEDDENVERYFIGESGLLDTNHG